jgi:hypothetical protein
LFFDHLSSSKVGRCAALLLLLRLLLCLFSLAKKRRTIQEWGKNIFRLTSRY